MAHGSDRGVGMKAGTTESSFDDAQAWCDLAEAVDLGRIWSASRIACEHRLAIDRLWAPEDDGLQPDDVRKRRTDSDTSAVRRR